MEQTGYPFEWRVVPKTERGIRTASERQETNTECGRVPAGDSPIRVISQVRSVDYVVFWSHLDQQGKQPITKRSSVNFLWPC